MAPPTSRRAPRFRSIATRLERWFETEQRDLPWRRTYDPWQVWVSEVMLQQTRMEVVVPFFERFLTRFPDAASLAAASEDEVLALWSGLGYYRRARMLRDGAVRLAERGGAIPREVGELREVPGIGRYTAGAIASIAFERPEPLVEGNVTRVAARLEALEPAAGTAELSSEAWAWAGALIREAGSPRNLNQALMELGATVCRPRKPACEACPVSSLCRALRSGKPERWPRPRERRRPAVGMVIPLLVVMRRGGKILFRKESEGSLLRSMLRLPHGTPDLHEDRDLALDATERLGSFRHTITHRRIVFEVWRATPRGRSPGNGGSWMWLKLEELASHPHPSYVRKAMAIVAAQLSKIHGPNVR